jgi:hypothetical protein
MNCIIKYKEVLTSFNSISLKNNNNYFLYEKISEYSRTVNKKILYFLYKKYDTFTDYQKFILIFTIIVGGYKSLFKRILYNNMFNAFIEYNNTLLVDVIINAKLVSVYKSYIISITILLSNLALDDEVLSFDELKIKKSHIIYLFKIAFYTNNYIIIKLIIKHPLHNKFNNEIINGLSYCYDLLKIVKYDKNDIIDKCFIYKPIFIRKIVELKFLFILNTFFNKYFDCIIDFMEYRSKKNIDNEVQKLLFMYDRSFNLHLVTFKIMNENKKANHYDTDNDY